MFIGPHRCLTPARSPKLLKAALVAAFIRSDAALAPNTSRSLGLLISQTFSARGILLQFKAFPAITKASVH